MADPFLTVPGELTMADPDASGKVDSLNEGVVGAANITQHMLDTDLTAEVTSYTLPYVATYGEDKSGLHVRVYKFSGTPAGALDINHPAVEHYFSVWNTCGQTLNIQVTGGAGLGVSIPTGKVVLIHCDGADCIDVTPVPSSVAIYRLTVPGEQTGNFQITTAMENYFIPCNSGSNINVTLPDDATDNCPIGYTADIHRRGTGSVTFVAGGTATIDSPDTLLTIRARYSTVAATKVAADRWVLSGDLG